MKLQTYEFLVRVVLGKVSRRSSDARYAIDLPSLQRHNS